MNMMIISENRKLVSELCHYVLPSNSYNIELVFTSSNALEFFSESKPELVILDSSTIVPYKTLVDSILDFSPKCRILVISRSSNSSMSLPGSVLTIDRADLSRRSLYEKLELFNKNVSESDISSHDISLDFGAPVPFRLYHDYYSLIYICFVERPGLNKDRLYSMIKKTGQEIVKTEMLDSLLYDGPDVLVIFRVSSGVQEKRVISSAQRFTAMKDAGHPCFTLFTFRQIPWHMLSECISGLKNYKSYAYFLPGQTLPADYIDQHKKPVPFNVIDMYVYKITQYVLQFCEEEAINSASELLFYYIKPSLDHDGLQYCRKSLINSLLIVSDSEEADFPELMAAEPTIYDTYEQFKKMILLSISILRHRRFSQVTINAIRYAFANIAEDVSLSTAADALSLSREHLAHIFKNDTGQTFLQFLQLLKIEKAKLLLETTNQKISEIAAGTGYRDPQYFGRVMKKSTGISPEKYRRLYRALREQYQSDTENDK